MEEQDLTSTSPQVVGWRLNKLEEGFTELRLAIEPLKPLPMLLSRLETTVDRIESKIDKTEQQKVDDEKHDEQMTIAKQGLHQAYSSQAQYRLIAVISLISGAFMSLLTIIISHFLR